MSAGASFLWWRPKSHSNPVGLHPHEGNCRNAHCPSRGACFLYHTPPHTTFFPLQFQPQPPSQNATALSGGYGGLSLEKVFYGVPFAVGKEGCTRRVSIPGELSAHQLFPVAVAPGYPLVPHVRSFLVFRGGSQGGGQVCGRVCQPTWVWIGSTAGARALSGPRATTGWKIVCPPHIRWRATCPKGWERNR